MKVLKKFLGYLRNWNIIDIQFVSLDEKEKQIKRTFERLKLYPVRHVMIRLLGSKRMYNTVYPNFMAL
jgi:hypothetical protein